MDHDDYLTQVYQALGSVPNAPFNSWVQDDLKEWYFGQNRKPDTVMTQALQLYNNNKKRRMDNQGSQRSEAHRSHD